MKNEFVTAIGTAVVVGAISYFVCNLLLPKTEPVEIKSVGSISITVDSPDPNVFNSQAINPTVEVYVGECNDIDQESGECRDEEPSSTGDNEDILNILKGDR